MKVLRLMACALAMVFLMSTTPEAKAPADCAACANCYPNWPCLKCAALVVHAIGDCCGASGGWASCVNTEWGFYASCQVTSWQCQCNAIGGNCVPIY